MPAPWSLSVRAAGRDAQAAAARRIVSPAAVTTDALSPIVRIVIMPFSLRIRVDDIRP
jgi:hypothetical protein